MIKTSAMCAIALEPIEIIKPSKWGLTYAIYWYSVVS